MLRRVGLASTINTLLKLAQRVLKATPPSLKPILFLRPLNLHDPPIRPHKPPPDASILQIPSNKLANITRSRPASRTLTTQHDAMLLALPAAQQLVPAVLNHPPLLRRVRLQDHAQVERLGRRHEREGLQQRVDVCAVLFVAGRRGDGREEAGRAVLFSEAVGGGDVLLEGVRGGRAREEEGVAACALEGVGVAVGDYCVASAYT